MGEQHDDDDRDVFGQVGRATVELQQEGLRATQRWSESVTTMLAEQAEQQRAVTRALTASLDAMESALRSQEETNRALRESIDAYREVIGGAARTQQQTADLLRTALGNAVTVQRQQVDAARTVLRSTSVPAESVTRMMDQWADAYRTLFDTFLPRPPGDED